MSELLQKSLLIAYHERSKHRFEAFAEGPGQLDWDAQPAAFRHYLGAPKSSLPLSADRFDRPYGQLEKPPEIEIPANLDSLGALLELSLGLSAWKTWGPNRWALRCNPSSGNLHPVEAYVLSAGLEEVPDGLHHYDPLDHALEGRALRRADGQRWLLVGLSSIMWREAWKYGERAFRYCQLDVGHATGAIAYAAALLGWEVSTLVIPGRSLAHLLGIDRPQDFPPYRYAYTDAEEPEVLLQIHVPGLAPPPEDLIDWLSCVDWQGTPSAIDPAPGYRWPVIGQIALASRPSARPRSTGKSGEISNWPPRTPPGTAAGAAQIIRQRRSAQRFDPKALLPKADFYRLLDAVLPRATFPFQALATPPAIHLLLFVQRVDGLPPGLYLLPRTAGAATRLPGVLGQVDERFSGQCRVADVDPDCPAHLPLVLLAALDLTEVQRLSRALSCHQDIASTSAFSLGMLGHFAGVEADGYTYRELLREAGLVGQVLYLEAEAAGVRGTGIGCFFDDPVHQAFGLDDPEWQSVYHFTVGTPVSDSRIESGPPYPQRNIDTP